MTTKTPETTKTRAAAKPASWAERLAALPPEEAKAIRAKAAEASRISKARKRGTTPEQSAVDRLESKLAKIDANLAELKAAHAGFTLELKAARAALKAVEKTPAAKEATDGADHA